MVNNPTPSGVVFFIAKMYASKVKLVGISKQTIIVKVVGEKQTTTCSFPKRNGNCLFRYANKTERA
jgi:hypothetical protein